MERLTAYLNNILLLHDCVILPGFGGFVCRTQSAAIDYENHTVSAPRKVISFNSSLSENDGLFADFIARKERIPYQDALRRLNVLVDNLKRDLEVERKVSLGKVGTLYYDRLSNIIFKQGEGNFFAGAFAGNSIPLPCEIRRLAPSVKGKPSGMQIELKKALTRGIAAAMIAGGIFGLYRLSPDLFEMENYWNNDKASFESAFPFFPESPQKKNCESVISPDCDYLDFLADI